MIDRHSLKVLKVANGLPPRARGGVESYTLAQCRALAARGHRPMVFCREGESGRRDHSVRDETVEGVPVRRVANDFHVVRGFGDYYYNAAIEQVFADTLAAWRPDVVHFEHAIGLSASLPVRSAAEGVPTVWTLSDFWPMCPVTNLLLRDGTLCPGSHRDVNCFVCVFGNPRAVPGRHIPPCPEAGSRADGDGVRALPATALHTLRRVLPRPARLALLGAYNRADDLVHTFRHARTASAPADGDASPDVRETVAATAAPIRPPAVAFRAEYMRRMLAGCDAIVALLPFIVDMYVDFGVPRERFRVIEAGMDLAAWSRQGRPPRPDGAPFRIGFIGSLMRHKGVDLAVRAVATVPDPNVELLLHGFFVPGDDYARSLRQLASRDPRVRFMGAYDPPDLPAILAGVDVLVVPSPWPETFSFVAREAVLAGVPVLASDLGGLRAAVDDGVNGLLLPPGDVDAWAAAIRRLAASPDLVRGMSAAQGARTVRSIETNVADLERLYLDVIDRRSARSERLGRAERLEQAEQAERTECPDRTERTAATAASARTTEEVA